MTAINELAPPGLSGLVSLHVKDGVGHLILNRPEAGNAIDSAMSVALCSAIGKAATADVGAVLVSARGKQFCVGGDVQAFAHPDGELSQALADLVDRLHPAVQALSALEVPVICAVQGAAAGAGIALALCADIVLASPEMRLRSGYSAIGLSPDLGASFHLSRRAGAARAKWILLTNRSIPAETCLDWGLVDEVHPAGDLMNAAWTMARQLARGPRLSHAAAKQLCDVAHGHDLAAHLSLEREALLRCACTEDALEGVEAFLHKRAPRFAGHPHIS